MADEINNLTTFAKNLVEAVSYLAIAGLGWKVALWIIELIM